MVFTVFVPALILHAIPQFRLRHAGRTSMVVFPRQIPGEFDFLCSTNWVKLERLLAMLIVFCSFVAFMALDI